jgi:hypothetical protein
MIAAGFVWLAMGAVLYAALRPALGARWAILAVGLMLVIGAALLSATQLGVWSL